jgi:hypothetical protein
VLGAVFALALGTLIAYVSSSLMMAAAVCFGAVHADSSWIFICLSGGIGAFMTFGIFQFTEGMRRYVCGYEDLK